MTVDQLHQVELLVRRLGDDAEMVIAVLVDGHRLDLPEGAVVTIEHRAGAGVPTVSVPVLAGRVRYVEEDGG